MNLDQEFRSSGIQNGSHGYEDMKKRSYSCEDLRKITRFSDYVEL
jgi:hypothetical protein